METITRGSPHSCALHRDSCNVATTLVGRLPGRNPTIRGGPESATNSATFTARTSSEPSCSADQRLVAPRAASAPPHLAKYRRKMARVGTAISGLCGGLGYLLRRHCQSPQPMPPQPMQSPHPMGSPKAECVRGQSQLHHLHAFANVHEFSRPFILKLSKPCLRLGEADFAAVLRHAAAGVDLSNRSLRLDQANIATVHHLAVVEVGLGNRSLPAQLSRLRCHVPSCCGQSQTKIAPPWHSMKTLLVWPPLPPPEPLLHLDVLLEVVLARSVANPPRTPEWTKRHPPPRYRWQGMRFNFWCV